MADTVPTPPSFGIRSSLPRRRFDAVIVGAGGSGMRASLQLAEAGLRVALVEMKPVAM